MGNGLSCNEGIGERQAARFGHRQIRARNEMRVVIEISLLRFASVEMTEVGGFAWVVITNGIAPFERQRSGLRFR